MAVVNQNNMDPLPSVKVFGFGKCKTLLDASIQTVVNNLSWCIHNVEGLPGNLKDKCLYLMSKRGTITDSNIDKVVHESLQVLDLSESEISDIGLSCLNRCPKLQKIDLNSAKKSRTSITSQGITSLSQSCHALQTVYLRRCLNITDEAVIALSQNCPQLRLLNVGGCTLLTDRSLQFLAQNSKFLKCLNMSNTKVTDNGVIALTSGQCAETLKEIHINGCVALTDEAVEAVLQFCPQIEILLFHACPKITENSRQALEDLTIQRKSPMKQVTWTIY